MFFFPPYSLSEYLAQAEQLFQQKKYPDRALIAARGDDCKSGRHNRNLRPWHQYIDVISTRYRSHALSVQFFKNMVNPADIINNVIVINQLHDLFTHNPTVHHDDGLCQYRTYFVPLIMDKK